MAHGQLRMVLRHLRRAIGGPGAGELSDRQLLERFAAGHDEDAFAALVRRHGPLVWGVCWRTLRHVQDAEDCFQATLLVLARKAGAVRWRDSVAGWLYEVATRVAAEMRTRNARRQARECLTATPPEPAAAPASAARDLCAVLDDELRSLPEKYRAPLLLCYLEGRTADRAARQLGWSLRTLERRLAQGRERLRARLTRRGLTLSGVQLAAALSEEAARAAVPTGLVASTARAVSSTAGASATVIALADAALRGVPMTKLQLLTVALLLGATAGTGLLIGRTPARPPEAVLAVSEPLPPGAGQPPAGKDENAKPSAPAPSDPARRMWAIIEVVQANHLEPRPRSEMILAGVRGMVKAAGGAVPDDLERRAAAVGSDAQLRDLLRAVWPQDGDAEKLDKALFAGLLESIPGQPNLLTDVNIKVMDQISNNRYVGIGIQIAYHAEERRPQIRIPFRGGAAYRAGVKPNDLLLEVDGRSTESVALQKVVEMLRGDEGSAVTIVVRQPGTAESRTMHLVRAVTPFDSLVGFRRAAGDGWDYRADPQARIAYARVESIRSSTLHELRQLERQLQAEGMKALVLDFRDSAGEGMLQHAALVADGLLDGGLMWTVRGTGGPAKEYRADRECLFRGWPLAVLVNGIADNAQGAVLAALQDSHRAVLVGEPGRSDGLVRQLFRLPDQSGITVVTGRLERADKSRGWPVAPDVTVGLTDVQLAAVRQWFAAKDMPESPPGADKPPDDPQLARALALLRDALKAGSSPARGAAAGGK